jgi:hypothetical protein
LGLAVGEALSVQKGQKQRPTTAKRCSSGTGRPVFFWISPGGSTFVSLFTVELRTVTQ